MMRTRSSGRIRAQPSISARLRPQPMQSAEIGSTAHTLLQGLSTSVMGGRADVMSKIKIAARKANSVANCTFALPAAGAVAGVATAAIDRRALDRGPMGVMGCRRWKIQLIAALSHVAGAEHGSRHEALRRRSRAQSPAHAHLFGREGDYVAHGASRYRRHGTEVPDLRRDQSTQASPGAGTGRWHGDHGIDRNLPLLRGAQARSAAVRAWGSGAGAHRDV